MKKAYYIFLLLFACCTTSKVVTDYDAKTNFSKFKTYGFYDDVGDGLNEFDVKRVANSIHLKMKELGFLESETPDFLINFKAKISEAQNNNTLGIGIGRGSRNGGFGISGGIPIGGTKMNEEFTLEFVNAKNNELFWQAILNSKIKEKREPVEKEVHFKEIVSKILATYPTKKN